MGVWWQRLTKRQRLIVMGVGGALALMSVDAIGLRPLRQQVRELHQQVRDAEQRLADAVIASGQAKAVNSAYAAYAPYLQSKGSVDTELAAALSEVESAVRQSGMVLLSLKPETGRPGSGQMISASVEGESTSSQLVQLLDLLQRSKRLLRVTELSARVVEGKKIRSFIVISKLLLK